VTFMHRACARPGFLVAATLSKQLPLLRRRDEYLGDQRSIFVKSPQSCETNEATEIFRTLLRHKLNPEVAEQLSDSVIGSEVHSTACFSFWGE
jgi:hypothetical protein